MGKDIIKNLYKITCIILLVLLILILIYKKCIRLNNFNEAQKLGAFCAIISTPTNAHYDVVLDYLNYDIHILLEKPAFLDNKHFTDIINKTNYKFVSEWTKDIIGLMNNEYS